MEGPNKNAEQIVTPETHGSRIRGAEVVVRGLFDEKMETRSVVRNIVEENKSSFVGPEERG